MDTSYPDENARLRALLQEQQTTIRKMAEFNRLKALVAKLQLMQFGKSSEKLREKTQSPVFACTASHWAVWTSPARPER